MTFRDGRPPRPGEFYTDRSVDGNGRPLSVGDVIHDPGLSADGVVVAVAGDLLLYLLLPPRPRPLRNASAFVFSECHRVTFRRHADDLLAEVERVGLAADE